MKEDKEKKEQICWYVQHDGDVLGPLSSSAVRRALLLDQVSLSDAVSKDGRIWRPLISVPEVVPPQLRRAGGEYGENRGESAARAEWLRLGAEKTPFLTLVLSITLVAVIIGYGLYKGGTPEPPVPDCSALPMPEVNWRNCSLNGIKAPSADLSRADIYSASLRGAMLSGGIFTDGNLEYADLSDADLSYALLNGAQMKGANLQNADLTNADLTDADLSFATLRGAAPGGVILKNTRLDNAVWFDGGQCLPGSIDGCVKSVP